MYEEKQKCGSSFWLPKKNLAGTKQKHQNFKRLKIGHKLKGKYV